MNNQPPFNGFQAPSFIPTGSPGTPTARGRPKGATTGAKRGRKPRGALLSSTSADGSPHPSTQDLPTTTATSWSQPSTSTSSVQGPTASNASTTVSNPAAPPPASGQSVQSGMGHSLSYPQSQSIGASGSDLQAQAHAVLSLPGIVIPVASAGAGASVGTPRPGADEDGEGEDEILPAMADDDYSAQLSWQSQSKDNLKCVFPFSIWSDGLLKGFYSRVLMDNFSPAQYDRFEAYRRHALPKQAVRKVYFRL
jgi:transcription initiation factor TFIID subunit 11